MSQALAYEGLSLEQARFAHEHHAIPGLRSADADRNVYVYHEGGLTTDRWLVDGIGQVVDFMRFHKSPG